MLRELSFCLSDFDRGQYLTSAVVLWVSALLYVHNVSLPNLNAVDFCS